MKAKRFQFQVGLVVVVVLGALSFLSACGGGSDAPVSPSPQSKPSTPSAQPAALPPSGAVTGGEIEVTLKEHTFPEEIRVKAGAKVVFVITNLGTETHSFEAPDFKLYKEIKSGQTDRLEWTVPDQKGSWDVGCFLTAPADVHDRMEGTLIIE